MIPISIIGVSTRPYTLWEACEHLINEPVPLDRYNMARPCDTWLTYHEQLLSDVATREFGRPMRIGICVPADFRANKQIWIYDKDKPEGYGRGSR